MKRRRTATVRRLVHGDLRAGPRKGSGVDIGTATGYATPGRYECLLRQF